VRSPENSPWCQTILPDIHRDLRAVTGPRWLLEVALREGSYDGSQDRESNVIRWMVGIWHLFAPGCVPGGSSPGFTSQTGHGGSYRCLGDESTEQKGP
jgi:hypothetical protein